jgi:glycosyltransferase involved in cell wall biosynthesis
MSARKRVAIVVQRWHPAVTGGSENHAWQYAKLLKDQFRVDLLTTTATDATLWRDVLPEGPQEIEGIRILRFRVPEPRRPYWHALHQALISEVESVGPGRRRCLDQRDGWTVALQREFIAKQGPFAPKLFDFLEKHHMDYAALLFVTYLYPTTYFGIEAAHSHPNTLLVPTLHDEAPAYLSTYQHMARKFRRILWNSSAERRLAGELWGPLDGEIVSMPIDCRLAERDASASATPFVLYSGRVDPYKGCQRMFDYFIEFKKRHPSALRLKITGVATMEIPGHRDIDFLGHVSNEAKTRLMRSARVFIMPSENESLSIVTLEAMAQETPVLAYAHGLVVSEHVLRSGAGRLFTDRETFIAGLSRLIHDNGDTTVGGVGAGGRNYVVNNYNEAVVRQRLVRNILPRENGAG